MNALKQQMNQTNNKIKVNIQEEIKKKDIYKQCFEVEEEELERSSETN